MLNLLLLLASCNLVQDPLISEIQNDPATPDEPTNMVNLSSAFFPEPPVRLTLPSTQLVVRDCYGGRPESVKVYSSGKGGSAAGRGNSTARKATAARSASPPPASPAPPADLLQAAPSGGDGRTRTTEIEALMAAPVAEAAASSRADEGTLADATSRDRDVRHSTPKAAKGRAEPASSDKTVASGASERVKDESKKAGSREKMDPAPDATRGLIAKEERAPSKGDTMTVRPAQEQKQPEMDWGATVYLSNDDSMSLASAQRMLYALQNNVRFQPSQVRPHELLNYFSFDTEPVGRGKMFSVLASAEQTGSDTLSVALAVKGASPPRLPLDLTLIVDRSGSMSAEGRMEYVKRGLHLVENNLRDGDRVDLVLFDSDVCTPMENFVVGRDSPGILRGAIDDMRPRNSTNMNAGLREGYKLALSHAQEHFDDSDKRNHRVMLLTDALLNTGEIDVNVVSEIGKAFDDHGIRLTGIGVGREFNDTVLDKLTEKGKGAYVFLGSEAVVDRIFGMSFESLTRTIAHNVRFALDLPPSLAMERFYGEESSTNAADVQPIHYYSGTSQVFLQDLKVRRGWLKDADAIRLTVSYEDAVTGKTGEQAFNATIGDLLAGEKHNLRKARALMSWTDVLIARALGSDPCGAPMREFRSRLDGLEDDAEIAFVDGLVAAKCDDVPALTKRVTPTGVPLKVNVDADIPIAEVAVQCKSRQAAESLSSGQKVATFTVAPGPCTLTLRGATDMRAQVEVPAQGGTVRCLIRGGRMSCS